MEHDFINNCYLSSIAQHFDKLLKNALCVFNKAEKQKEYIFFYHRKIDQTRIFILIWVFNKHYSPFICLF
jgi:hypothetical protein